MVVDGAGRLRSTALCWQRQSAAVGVRRLERERVRILNRLPMDPAQRAAAIATAADLARRADQARQLLLEWSA